VRSIPNFVRLLSAFSAITRILQGFEGVISRARKSSNLMQLFPKEPPIALDLANEVY
jgi:hypothetical protein